MVIGSMLRMTGRAAALEKAATGFVALLILPVMLMSNQELSMCGSNFLRGPTVGAALIGLFLAGPAGAQLSPTHIFWTDQNTETISRANLDGTGVEHLVTLSNGAANPSGIALDLLHNKVYWTEPGLGGGPGQRIERANLDGTGVEPLSISGISSPTDIALDVARGKLYWTDQNTDSIGRANLDGTSAEILVTLSNAGANPWGIAVDVVGDKVYWTEPGGGDGPGHRIQRANLDGTGVEPLSISGISSPTDVALDVARGKLYWTDQNTDSISRANLDGTGVERLVTLSNGAANPRGIALDLFHDKVYWTEPGSGGGPGHRIERANLDGTGVEPLLIPGMGSPTGIAVVYIPEPSTLLMMGIGAVGLLLYALRKRR